MSQSDWQEITDSGIHLQIKTVNSIIQEYNTRHNYTSPKFYQNQKRMKEGENTTKTRYSLDPGLHEDGVHPITNSQNLGTDVQRNIVKFKYRISN